MDFYIGDSYLRTNVKIFDLKILIKNSKVGRRKEKKI